MIAFLPEITSSFSLHTIITLGFYGASAMYIIFTNLLYFHWNQYSINDAVTKTTLILYFLITLPIMAVLGITTLII